MRQYIENPKRDAIIVACMNVAGYNGNKVQVSTDIPSRLDSYWDGGSRDYYWFFEPTTGKGYSVHSNHPFFEKGQPNELDKLPQGVLLIEHSIFCGKDAGITIYANQDAIAPLLAAPVDLTEDEKLVLEYTRSYVSSYAGESNYRFKECRHDNGITSARWEAAKASCIAKGLLNKAGAITSKGKNAIGG